MMKIEIKNRWSGNILFKGEFDNLKLAVEAAVKAKANLRDASLTGTDLRYIDLRDADLTGTDLRGADLRGADLRNTDMTGTDMTGASLMGAKNIPDSYTRLLSRRTQQTMPTN